QRFREEPSRRRPRRDFAAHRLDDRLDRVVAFERRRPTEALRRAGEQCPLEPLGRQAHRRRTPAALHLGYMETMFARAERHPAVSALEGALSPFQGERELHLPVEDDQHALIAVEERRDTDFSRVANAVHLEREARPRGVSAVQKRRAPFWIRRRWPGFVS